MRNLLAVLILIAVIACKKKNEINESYKVEFKGALKNIMHKGDITAKADLLDFEHTKNLYALGAIENLKGEIQIFDSEPYNTSVVDSLLKFDKSFKRKASLFVYASVNDWNTIAIPNNIKTYEQLELFVKETAESNDINMNKPFPFLIEGVISSFNWHVIDWKDGDTEHSHQKHINSGLNGLEKNKEAKVLGFYSNSHHAIFTHHTTNIHMHIKTIDNKIAGHLDDLTLGDNMILKLPKLN